MTIRALLVVPLLVFAVGFASAVHAQTGTIAGTITSASMGEPIPGVNVLVEGTQLGAATGADGTYEVAGVEPGTYTVVASFIGYGDESEEDVEVTAGDTTTVDIAMQQAATGLDEVVVVGYGEQQREDVTAATSSVPLQDLESRPVTGLNDAITGKVAGVRVSTVTGVPGGGSTVRVRGVGSVGAGNDPLYVIDGFPISSSSGQRVNPLNSIPPEQIESIEVLKDASATSIYGSRGANGVILVTTKGGTVDTQVQVNSSIGTQNPRERGMVDVLNAREFAQYKNERLSDQIRFQEGREPVPEDIPEMYRNPEQYGEGTDWPSELRQTGVTHNHSISVSGGSEAIRARVSGSFQDQKGTLINTGYRRYGIRANVSADLNDRLHAGLNIAPSLENQELTSTDGVDGRAGVYPSAFLVNPIQPVRDADGNLTQMVDGPGILPFPNPVFKSGAVDNNVERVRTLANAYVEYELAEGLDVETRFNVDWENSDQTRYKPTTVGGIYFTYPPQPAEGLYENIERLNWLSENTLNYRWDRGAHSVDALAGFTIQEERTDVGDFEATNYPDDEVQTLNAAATINGRTAINEWGLISGLARLNYNYNDRYLLSATVRRDGSSRFGENNRWGTFPSFSVGWRVSGEGFMEDADYLENLLIRFGYGLSGNFNIGNYQYLGTLSFTNYALGNDRLAGRSITNLGNSGLGWEEVEQLNFGFDLSLFQNRLSVSADYYRKVSSGMLLGVETPLASGFSQTLDNRGEVTNRGIEFAVDSDVIDRSSFGWNASFNISRNVNEVTELDSRLLAPTSTALHITEEGHPIGTFYGYVVEGIYQSEEEIQDHLPNGNAMVGAYRYKDVNGDGEITPIDDFERTGSPFPDFEWGLTNSLNYGSLDFSVQVTGSHGGEILQKGYSNLHNLDGVFNVTTDAIGRWRSPEDPGAGLIPRAISTVVHRYGRDLWVLDSSNIWIRNVSLGYTFGASRYGLIDSFGASDIRVYLNASNLWISNTNFQNPEVSLNSGNPLQPGQAQNLNYPISRSFTLGLNVSF